MPSKKSQLQLLDWYHANKRDLPWRANRDPYRIWISETMLQQTTTTAVIPYFERFLKRFPTLKSLATSDVGEVIEAWAGLGYYSRARNLFKAAQALHQEKTFPQSYKRLLEFSGFGPYTARSVASLAFDESVGVVDGNVIRVLSRYLGEAWDFWQSSVRNQIQEEADRWVEGVSSRDMNQALMELGRTICMPRTPTCLLCPLRNSCVAFAKGLQTQLPKSKPRRAREIWHWEPQIEIKNGRLLLGLNQNLPFLKGQWILPGQGKRSHKAPKVFHYKHSITHHDIFVTLSNSRPKICLSDLKWVALKDLKKNVPVSLVHKALAEFMDRDLSSDSTRRASGTHGVLKQGQKRQRPRKAERTNIGE